MEFIYNLSINSCLPLCHPSRKTERVFKNPENADMVRKISFQAKIIFSASMKC
jgi:hypothetical protein